MRAITIGKGVVSLDQIGQGSLAFEQVMMKGNDFPQHRGPQFGRELRVKFGVRLAIGFKAGEPIGLGCKPLGQGPGSPIFKHAAYLTLQFFRAGQALFLGAFQQLGIRQGLPN